MRIKVSGQRYCIGHVKVEYQNRDDPEISCADTFPNPLGSIGTEARYHGLQASRGLLAPLPSGVTKPRDSRVGYSRFRKCKSRPKIGLAVGFMRLKKKQSLICESSRQKDVQGTGRARYLACTGLWARIITHSPLEMWSPGHSVLARFTHWKPVRQP